jgi:hypothetical protein
MGKVKNAAYGCWEMWHCNQENPDWETIGRSNGLDAKTAKAWALGWEDNLQQQVWRDR